MFSLICVWINGWVNSREVGDLRRHRGHYDVTVMHRFSHRSHISPRALDWMVEKICNKLIFSGIVRQATMNDISKIPWNPNCGNYEIIGKISFLVPLLLGKIPAFLMTWCALQGLSPLPQRSLFHTPHMVWLAACQALRDGADAVVWNSLSVNREWLQLTTLSYHNKYLVAS